MPSRKTQQPPKVADSRDTPTPGERERWRDIIIIFVAYPITPTERAEKAGSKRPWLEILSVLIKLIAAVAGLAKVFVELRG